ncbi:substrate-binding domain-containing protein [Dyadobacter frigoris]|uniref:histidine kinase n=1 Tax=Dyadobacter frigoris TaxID=2576211 RepID=A0A4U6CV40_9BACT|nr:substrate-binding domain-containing protein [Dyadobacter frigoris]TKT87605.1 substrate-binding domain-containing protein [Dyadobacter frigoris]
MKSAALILFILLISFGCSREQPKQFTIGFSQCTGGDNWRKTMLENMHRELSFHPEIDFVMKDAAGQSLKQIDQIQQLMDQKVDLLIVSPNEAQRITPIVEKAYQIGIPVIIVDRRTMSDQYTAYVGAENIEVGRTAGIYANTVLKGKGNVVEISELPGSSADIDRHKGFVEAISRFPGIRLVAKLDGDWDKYSFENDLTALLKSDRLIDFIYCQNDRRAISAFEICKKLGLQKRIKIIGVDGLNGKNEGIDLVDRDILNATIIYPTGGEESIRTAINILGKQPFKRENRLQSTLIDSSNVRIMKLQNQKVMAQQEDIERRQRKIEEQRAISENQSIIIYAISITLALALLFGALSFYSLRENRKINKRLEKQNHEISDQKDQISQMAEKATVEHEAKLKFFTNISHEFRTPLTLILAPVEDLLDNGKIKDSLVKQELNLIRKNAFRLLRLVNQLMDFRKIEGHKMMIRASEQNLVGFLKDIMASFEKMAVKRKIDFRLITSEPQIAVWFDVNMLDKVIFNLLSNAFKFTQDKGRIYIYVKSVSGCSVKITIEDNGHGMTKSEVQHAFEIFYQGEGSYKTLGTGLGLALSKELINLHHGRISVESEHGKETKFTIELPLGKEHFEENEIWNEPTDEISLVRSMEIPEEKMTETPDTKSAVHHEQTILLIEDNDDLIRLVEQKLQDNYLIIKSSNGEEGLEFAFDQIPDLIVCDIMLPGKDGLHVASVLKSDFRTSHIPIILLTAKNTAEQQIEGIQTGVDAYITKPFNLKFVEETIKTLLRNRSILREHYTSELPIETTSANNPNKLDKKFVTEFTAYIEEHYGNSDLNVEDIAKDMGMSRVQLYRKVKALLGFSVNEYIQQIRLNKARFLLRRNDLTVADIAYSVGFSSPTYFSTAFKAKYNQTPLEYKNARTL